MWRSESHGYVLHGDRRRCGGLSLMGTCSMVIVSVLEPICHESGSMDEEDS
jgi:hypothetical protein